MISLNPKTFTKGGLFSDVDVEILDFYFTLESPEGYTVADRVFAKADMKILSDGALVDNFYSAGKSADFVPSKDGPGEGTGYALEETGSRTALNDNTNISIFMAELVKCGFPPERLDSGRLDVLKGLVCHVVRIPTKREGLERDKKEGARPDTVLVPNKIIKLPGGAAKKGPAAAKKGGASTPAAEAAADAGGAEGAGDDVKAVVLKLLAEDGVTNVKKLKASLLRAFMKDADRAAKIAAGMSEETLLDLGYMIEGEEIAKV